MQYDAIILAGGPATRLGGANKAQLLLHGRPLVDRPLAACRDARRVALVGPPEALGTAGGLDSTSAAAADSATDPAGRSSTGLADDLPTSAIGMATGPVTGPVDDEPGSRPQLMLCRENPPGGGPVAATLAGLRALAEPPALHQGDPPWLLLLSCDLPGAADGVPLLLAAAARDLARSSQRDGVRSPDGWCLTDSEGRPQWLFALYRTSSLRQAASAHPDPDGMSMRRLLADLDLVGIPDPHRHSDDLDSWSDHAAWTARLETDE